MRSSRERSFTARLRYLFIYFLVIFIRQILRRATIIYQWQVSGVLWKTIVDRNNVEGLRIKLIRMEKDF